MLVLLMVFMITTPLLNQSVKVQLPKTKAQQVNQTKQKPIIVTVNKAGQYYLSIAKDPTLALSQTELKNLVNKAIASNKARNVYVRGDSAASYGAIVKAMAMLQDAGATHVGLITNPASK
jgi:biopolymer transport protein TolR